MDAFLKPFYKFAIKVKGKKKLIQQYMELNSDIMTIVNDIESLRMNSDDPKVNFKIKALEKTKEKLSKYLIEIEEEFYNVEKGLWIGLAYDLKDVDKPPFLLYLPWKNLHNHIEVFGTSGYGKSRLMALVIRQFIHFDWSLFAVDPKGGERQEVAQWIYDFAAEAGLEHLVMRIMPSYPELSDKGNPIFGMTDVEIASMGSSLTVSGSGTQSSEEQFFSGQVYKILYSILSATTYLENAIDPYKIEVNKKIVDEVKKYIAFKERKSLPVTYNDSDVQYPDYAKIAVSNPEKYQVTTSVSAHTRTLITFRELAFFTIYENIKELHKTVLNVPVPKLENDKAKEKEISAMKDLALKALNEVTKLGKDYYDKVGNSLSVLLFQLAYGPVGSVLCDIRINPLVKRARDKEGMIVLFQPAPMRFEKVSEILIKVYTRMWLSLFGTVGVSGRGIEKRVAMVIDEAKPMMFPGIEEIYNKARQLGMTIMALFQSKSDMKFKLGDVLADITQDNTATSISMKQVSNNSRREVAESYGTLKVATNIQMSESDGVGRSTTAWQEMEYVNADDVNDLQIGEGFVQHYGNKYYVKFPYQRDPMPINVTMPTLESENSYEFIAQIESMLANNEQAINQINYENALKVGA